MTTYDTPTPAAAAAGTQPPRGHLGLPHLVWALAATYFVSRAGGLVRWSNRWKAALNAFEITFDGRLSAGRK